MVGARASDSPPRDDAGYLIVDARWRIVAADDSNSLVADGGQTSLIGQHVRDVIGPDALAELERHGVATFTIDNVEYVLTGTPFTLPTGKVTLIRAQETQATLEHVVSLIVHEVRNPLSAMRALVQGLEEEVGDVGNSAAYTKRLTDEIDRLGRLLHSMAQVARLRAREPELLQPGEVLERAAATFRPALEQRGIRLNVNATPHVGPILGDPDQIQQVLVNLVTNAADAMPDGGAITLRARLDPQGHTTLQIEDTGVGMSPEALERALRPRQSSKSGGMGLGLMIVRGIIRQHHARMRMTSAPGKGTTISITFPSPTDDTEILTP
ncbi:MAG TPA: HAMP domain-containing sensor histidine kinase [Ktedonobacterales bacterium]